MLCMADMQLTICAPSEPLSDLASDLATDPAPHVEFLHTLSQHSAEENEAGFTDTTDERIRWRSGGLRNIVAHPQLPPRCRQLGGYWEPAAAQPQCVRRGCGQCPREGL